MFWTIGHLFRHFVIFNGLAIIDSEFRFLFCIYRYPPEAPELQIRKMADLCFLVQHYDLAYSCYHTAKKDFLNDQAMLYAAGALVGIL